MTQYFRFLTKTPGQTHLRALVLQSASAAEAAKRAKEALIAKESIISINVWKNDAWRVLKGAEVKGKTIQLHGRSDAVSGDINPLSDAVAEAQPETTSESPERQTDSDEIEADLVSEDALTVSARGDQDMPTYFAAAVEAFMVCVVRVFTISLSIWKGSAHRLAKKQNDSDDDGAAALRTDTEFPVFEWMKASWDGVIFLSWFVMPAITIYAANGGYRFDWGTFWAGMTMTYFLVIPLSLTKEALVLILSIALNVERISYKTTRSQISQE